MSVNWEHRRKKLQLQAPTEVSRHYCLHITVPNALSCDYIGHKKL